MDKEIYNQEGTKIDDVIHEGTSDESSECYPECPICNRDGKYHYQAIAIGDASEICWNEQKKCTIFFIHGKEFSVPFSEETSFEECRSQWLYAKYGALPEDRCTFIDIFKVGDRLCFHFMVNVLEGPCAL